MMFDIPEGTRVQIFIAPAALPPIPNPDPPQADRPLPRPLETRQRRPLLTCIAIALFAVVAFVVGRNTAPDRDVLTMARNASVPEVLPLPELRRPQLQLLPSEATAADPVPEAFARQLRQPPSIAPSPGSPPPAAPSTSAAKPFGLED
jgi:hypothetical protein